MNFPPVVTITVVEGSSRLPVPRVAVSLQLVAKIKNNYSVGPKITDDCGLVKFSRDDCKESIKRSKSMFVMDYAGNLDDCAPRLIARLLPSDNIATMIQNFERAPTFWGTAFDDPYELFLQLRAVENARFEPARLEVTENQMLQSPNVTLALVRKAGQTRTE